MSLIQLPKDLGTREHALLSPSAASRWISCPASVALIEKYGVEETTAAAEKGTAAHWVLEECLRYDLEPEEYLGKTAPNGYKITREMVHAVEFAVEWVEENCGPDDDLYAEARTDIYDNLDIPVRKPVIFGTVDIQIHRETELVIADFKNGVWGVSAHYNPQLELYAVGVLTDKLAEKFETVRVVILQPNNGGVKEQVYSVRDILGLRLWYSVLSTRALERGALTNPHAGNCKFCAAKRNCEAYEESKFDGIMDQLLS